MPLWEMNESGDLTFNKEVSDRIVKALRQYQLSMLDLAEASRILNKQKPDIDFKEDNYGNEYFECVDCHKKYTYQHFDGYCEKCGKRMIW